MELHDSYLSGNNPWDADTDASYTIRIRILEDPSADLVDMTECTARLYPETVEGPLVDLYKIFLVYDFYTACKNVVRHKAFGNVNINKCDYITFNIDDTVVALRTVLYFGSKRVKDAISTLEKSNDGSFLENDPRIIKLRRASMFSTQKTHVDGVDIVHPAGDAPFPKIEAIT